MAGEVLIEVAARIIEKSGGLAFQELGHLCGFKGEIEKLRNTVSTIKAELQYNYSDTKAWLEKVKVAIYDADNLVEDMSTEALRREVMTRDKKAKEVRIFFSKLNQLAYGLKMVHKVKAMRERLDIIARNWGFHLDECPVETHVVRREIYSFVGAENVIGRENDKKAIVGILLDSNVEEDVSILPIVGVGGIGKTTLAQLLFNDEKIMEHFEQRLWVCVSNKFDVKTIVEKILESTKNKKLETLEMHTLINDLKKEIYGKRYLLVLDDVWNENREKWFTLKALLMIGARGSRILVTTPSYEVAKIVQTIKPYFLKGLSMDQSWFLFIHMAFDNGQEPENSFLKRMGMRILRKCKGIPLIIRTVGSLLYFRNKEEWSFIDNELFKVSRFENDILPTLKISYDYLPSYLKQCFVYCSLFPKDYKFHKQTLIHMWIAQGFIRSSGQKLEDVGHNYFMELLRRSFFQEVEEDERGNKLHFKIHDLMHDLAILIG